MQLDKRPRHRRVLEPRSPACDCRGKETRVFGRVGKVGLALVPRHPREPKFANGVDHAVPYGARAVGEVRVGVAARIGRFVGRFC